MERRFFSETPSRQKEGEEVSEVKRYTGEEVERNSESNFPKWIHAADYVNATIQRDSALTAAFDAQAQIKALGEALKGLYLDAAEYAKINNMLGALNNQPMVNAREALAAAGITLD